MSGLQTHFDIQPNACILTLSGKAAATDAQQLDHAVDNAIATRPDLLVVDMENLEFVGSFAIGALIRLEKAVRAENGVVRLASPQPQIQTMLTQSRLDQRFPIFPTVESAIGRGVAS